MFRSLNHFLLHLGGQVHEIVAVACHPHDQVAVVLRLLLGLAQGRAVDDVELDVMPVQLEIGPHQVVGSRLARRIGRIGLIFLLFMIYIFFCML